MGVTVSAGRTELVVLVPSDAIYGLLQIKTGNGSLVSNDVYYASNGISFAPALSAINFVDPVSNSSTAELVVNQGNTIQANVKLVDDTGAVVEESP